MILPNVEQVFTELVEKLKDYLREQEIEDPLLVGIRTGGVWVTERIQQIGRASCRERV